MSEDLSLSDQIALCQEELISAITQREKSKIRDIEIKLAMLESDRSTLVSNQSHAKQKSNALTMLSSQDQHDVLCEVVFSSILSESMTEIEVAALCSRYSVRNYDSGITGALYTQPGVDVKVMCCYQGPATRIKSLMEKITNDRRHHTIVILRYREIAMRCDETSSFGLKYYPPQDSALFQTLFDVASQSSMYVPEDARAALIRGGSPLNTNEYNKTVVIVAARFNTSSPSKQTLDTHTAVFSELYEKSGAERFVLQGSEVFFTFSPRMYDSAMECGRRLYQLKYRCVLHIGEVMLSQHTSVCMVHLILSGGVIQECEEVLRLRSSKLFGGRPVMLCSKPFVDCCGKTTFQHLGFFDIVVGETGLESQVGEEEEKYQTKEISLYIPYDMKK